MSTNNTKTFYLHTPPAINYRGMCLGHRATIACRKEGDVIKFGYTICSKDDNFSRAEGRKKAEERLNKGFGAVDFNNNWFEHFPTPDAALLEFASTLSRSIQKNYNKYKRKLETYNHPVTKDA